MTLIEVESQSIEIREKYHALEERYHGTKWSAEEDALAFLTDAALVGRLVMAKEGRWPSDDTDTLPSKIGECVWWLAVLAKREGLHLSDCVEKFLTEKKCELG